MILNRCEVLGGFASTAAALPSNLRQGPFGWAPPAGLGPGFGPGWVDSSIGALTQQVAAMQARLLPPPDSAAAFTQLPTSLAALAQPLSTLLNNMLGAGVDHPAPMFRGFYLTGRAPLPGTGSTTGAQDVFAQRLFPDRLFPEHALAQPTTATVTRRGRQIRMIQAAACLLVLLALGSLVMLSNRQAGGRHGKRNDRAGRRHAAAMAGRQRSPPHPERLLPHHTPRPRRRRASRPATPCCGR